MKEREQTSSRQHRLHGSWPECVMDLVGEFASDGFIGFVLYVAIMVPIVLITTFLDW